MNAWASVMVRRESSATFRKCSPPPPPLPAFPGRPMTFSLQARPASTPCEPSRSTCSASIRNRSPQQVLHGLLDKNVLRNSLTLGFSVDFHHSEMLGITPCHLARCLAVSCGVVPYRRIRSWSGVKVETGSVNDAPKSLQKRRSLRLNQARTGPFLFHPAMAPSDRLIASLGMTRFSSNSRIVPSPLQ